MSFKNEKIIETKKCEKTGVLFDITDKDLEFYDKVSPVFNGKKYSIPTPKLCPEAREQRRLSFRNERNLYRRKCDFSGEDIISIYSPDKPYKVYSQDVWRSDKWDALDYGKDFDFSKSAFEQFDELLKEVPLKSSVSEYNENCNFTSICGYCKDCYLTVASEYTENSMYGHLLQKCRNIIDTNFAYNSENCYNCVDIENCNKCYFLLKSEGCYNCYSSTNLKGCRNCINCHNLVNQEYCIDNKKVTKEEFEKYISNYDFSFNNADIVRNLEIFNSENINGDSISGSKNIFNSFDINNSEDIKNSQIIVDGKTMYDCSNCYVSCSLSYEIMSSLSTVKNIFSAFIYNCSSSIYSINNNDSNNIFLSTGLKNKEYCILNKQYTKAEYEELVPKIIEHMQKTGEWGEFFPASISPFGYNETVAQEYFPLTKEEALS